MNNDIKVGIGSNALKAAKEKYNFAKQAGKLLKLYETV